MKTKFSILFALIMFAFIGTLSAKDILTKVTFKVSGNCETCEARIEKAAKIKGVKSADWNQETKEISVVYAPEKVDINSIKQSIADAGYDTDSIKATNASYKLLPQCCQYTR
ncbi:MAG: heavy-metal-associated domain-containing protein [Bacteroidetes bacterium]|nr:heavy-metal-associated domain-containing protein [Bacteroidota bacterium]